jgi:hypothetical protein
MVESVKISEKLIERGMREALEMVILIGYFFLLLIF